MTTNWTPTSTTRTRKANIEVRVMPERESLHLGDTLPEMFVPLGMDLGLLSVPGRFHHG